MSVIHTILDGRTVSLNGKPLICFHIKGDGIIRIVNRFTVLLRAFVRGRFQYPGVHLFLHRGTVVDPVIDLRVQLGFVHAELQSVIVDGGVDVVIARDFDGVCCLDRFRAFGRVGVFQRPAFLQFGDFCFVVFRFCFYFVQLFPVHRIGAGCGYISVRDVGDGRVVGIDTCRGDRRAARDGKTGFAESDVIARFEYFTADAFQSRERFIQLDFVAYFLARLLVIGNNQVVVFRGERRSFDGVYGSVYTRFFLRCDGHIVARFDGGSRRFELGDVHRIGIFRAACYIDDTAIRIGNLLLLQKLFISFCISVIHPCFRPLLVACTAHGDDAIVRGKFVFIAGQIGIRFDTVQCTDK